MFLFRNSSLIFPRFYTEYKQNDKFPRYYSDLQRRKETGAKSLGRYTLKKLSGGMLLFPVPSLIFEFSSNQ